MNLRLLPPEANEPDAPAGTLTFEILGPVRVLAGGHPLEVGGTGPLSLLACLILNANNVVPVEELVESMWGDEQPPSARRMVRMYAGRIRRALGVSDAGVPALVAEAPGFRLAVAPEHVDAYRFERLLEEARRVRTRDAEAALRLYGEALSLWRGPALAGVGCAERDATRLDELRISALEGSAEARLALGDLGGVIGDLEQLIAKYPLRERLHALLMTALYRAGRQSDALAHFKAFRRTLVEDLGVEPSAEVRQLELAILRQDPALDGPVVAALSDALPRQSARPSGRRRLHRKPLLAGAVLLAVVATVGAAFVWPAASGRLPAGSLGVLQLSTKKVAGHVLVGKKPSSVLLLAGSRALVATQGDRSVALVDWKQGRVVGRFGTGIAGGKLIAYQALLRRTAVVADSESRQLAVLDLDTTRKTGLPGSLIPLIIQVPYSSDGIADIVRVPGGGAYVTTDGWVVSVGSETHYEWEELAAHRIATTSGPLTYARGMIWMAPRGQRRLLAFNVGFSKVTRRIALPGRAGLIAASGDDLWVALANAPTLLHYSASLSSLVGRSALPGRPTALRATGGGAWVGTENGQLLHVSRRNAAVDVLAELHRPVGALAVRAGLLVFALD